MKTLNYLSDKIRFLKKLKTPEKSNAGENSIFELNHPDNKEHFEEDSEGHRESNIMLSLMYSNEDEALFI